MPDLREQLQAALGAGYRIEQELGGGGMSRVFLAEEVRLGRRVVVKVLPPQMAAGVSVDRFEREIQLAAKLQHPHVVPLLTAGASEDLLYYIMPYIEGESLRARLAREGELPVSEALRILHDVLDALAYAHRQHVVHRDIKPDNVLLSEGHALVTDFGVAKAVAESTGKTVLTSLGVALGTPAYMAPEQAVADPHVDHRADIYAVGVLAYEMLSGRLPFAASTPQAMLAAHVTEVPEPVIRHRAAVPDVLNQLILRCLEKKPADRWQRVDELLPQVDAILTPSGGLAPTGAQPVISSGTAAALARAHPVRVAGLFGLASVGVLAIVYALVRAIGLPDWVFYGTIGLLVAGLPVMLLTGRQERRRALARSSGQLTATPAGGLERHFTWRRALLGGGLAFGGLAALTAVYMAMRALGIGPVGTLLASGRLADRGLLVVADFGSHTTDSTLAPSVTEAFRIDLSQSPAVKVMDGAAVASTLQRMNRDPRTPLDVATAREIAQREGAKAVVVGDVGTLGKGYVLSARLLSSTDGSELLALRETADNDADIIAAVDRLSKHMRERIGESLKTIRANPPLEQVTTSSLEALRRYTEGARAIALGENTRAIQLLKEAVALDTTFAMAYRGLAIALFNSGGGRADRFAAASKAYQYRDRLPLRERYLAVANYEPAAEQQAAAYRALLETYPDDATALNNLAVADLMLGRYREAQQAAEHAMAVGHGLLTQPYGNTMDADLALGKVAAAESTLAALRRDLPQARLTFLSESADFAASRNDYDGAVADLDSARRLASDDPERRAGYEYRLAMFAALRGRLAQAETYLDEGLPGRQQRAPARATLNEAIALALLDLRFRDAPAAALRRVDAALASTPLGSIRVGNRPYLSLARLYAEAGRPEEARRLLTEYQHTVDEWFRLQAGPRNNYPVAMADIALSEGHVHDAISQLRQFRAGVHCPACGLFELATAYDRADQTDSALAYYTRLANTPAWGPPARAKFVSLAQSYKRLGELYEQKGDRDHALQYYGKFVDLWKNADPDLQPVVRDVKQRMARLAGESK